VADEQVDAAQVVKRAEVNAGVDVGQAPDEVDAGGSDPAAEA
jgi:hypothetical protein